MGRRLCAIMLHCNPSSKFIPTFNLRKSYTLAKHQHHHIIIHMRKSVSNSCALLHEKYIYDSSRLFADAQNPRASTHYLLHETVSHISCRWSAILLLGRARIAARPQIRKMISQSSSASRRIAFTCQPAFRVGHGLPAYARKASPGSAFSYSLPISCPWSLLSCPPIFSSWSTSYSTVPAGTSAPTSRTTSFYPCLPSRASSMSPSTHMLRISRSQKPIRITCSRLLPNSLPAPVSRCST
ncbi:hypothetical protein BCR44DRAFT_399691 [Catenaria anguillulae PL171]|uniref:Uncharacterized protein n=1 Tax=Catenaria anguillulae PL171 TaxID=765915 RepID=A0A1Y2HKG1_9FUNG|nr:hypothetical protein BCR44DRAFT_399691 [Catenaria anguillulae PL171]